ncbi:MAG: hypothetical protein O3A55_00155 [Bacteroidetes bacterium]|nr:hypothetical protein [Bacteroidota bacterium]
MSEVNTAPILIPNCSVLVCKISGEIKDESLQFLIATLKSRVEKHNGNLQLNESNKYLVYFNEAASSVNCAINIQETLLSYNLNIKSDKQINLQIGIHYGEIFISNNILQGEVVDIADDISTITPIKNIYVSKEVFNRTRIRLLVTMKPLGLKELTSTKISKEVYKVDWETIEINLSKSLGRIPNELSHKSKDNSPYEAKKETNKFMLFLILGLIIATLLYMRYQRWI